MRNRVARVARATIATNRPKSSEIVADITQSLLSTLHSAGFLRVEEHPALRKHKKHRDLPTRLPGAPFLLKMSISFSTLYHDLPGPTRGVRPVAGLLYLLYAWAKSSVSQTWFFESITTSTPARLKIVLRMF